MTYHQGPEDVVMREQLEDLTAHFQGHQIGEGLCPECDRFHYVRSLLLVPFVEKVETIWRRGKRFKFKVKGATG